ncbi:hypothetical protein VaNZ11_008719 [Volvox africanus]|uniref:Peptidase S1 domain-containing protein n=1 Tax=Volvox africanus TaxID=51714 RepID=A0ABQ5S624_9CHLO|nr:hypothetical protein VaNZ11_008719 [Volvox africanus]
MLAGDMMKLPGFWFLCTCCWLAGILVSIQASTSGGCSSCPLTYAPVVDADTGLPFYNECVAKCQLSPGANLVPAGSRRAAAADRSASASSQPDFLKLVPAPTAEASKDGGEVTSDTILRFTRQGYNYVGRTGLSAMLHDDKVTDKDTVTSGDANNTATAALSRTNEHLRNQDGATNGPTVTLRVIYPQGDLYMKVWNQSELKALVKKHTGPKSDSARLSLASIPAVEAADSDDNIPAPPMQAVSGIPSRQSARRLLRVKALGVDDRGEVPSPSYPYTAVSLLSTGCTGALVGPTGRLVLTAGQCLYKYNNDTKSPVSWYSNVTVAPSFHNRTVAPFGWIPAEGADVQVMWKSEGIWAANIGILRLAYHCNLPGSFSFGVRCGPLTQTLTTAGYPMDKPQFTMWMQSTVVTTDMCSGGEEKVFPFDAADGQVGSPFWNSENSVRFVLSRGSCCSNVGGAVAITPTYYFWMLDYTETNIVTTPVYNLVGGANRDQYIRCDAKSLRCLGTKTSSLSTSFYAYPVYSTSKYALRIPNTSLCLSLLQTNNISTPSVGLLKCNIDTFTFPPNSLWNFVTLDNIAVALTDSGFNLLWNGDTRQLTAVQNCALLSSPSQCKWYLEKIVSAAKKTVI